MRELEGSKTRTTLSTASTTSVTSTPTSVTSPTAASTRPQPRLQLLGRLVLVLGGRYLVRNVIDPGDGGDRPDIGDAAGADRPLVDDTADDAPDDMSTVIRTAGVVIGFRR